MRTSLSHPLDIAETRAPGWIGALGLCMCPGKFQRNGGTVLWSRDLQVDLQRIRGWGAACILSLMLEQERQRFGVSRLPDAAHAAGLAWIHLPIPDGNAPGVQARQQWPTVSRQLLARLERGENVLVHCLAGTGRTGTVAAWLLMEAGMSAEDAIAQVRAVRPKAIENAGQEAFLRGAGAICSAGE